MTLQELYDQIGGNYEEAISRLRMEKLVSRFVIRFLGDTSCKDLIDSWKSGDEEATFRAAHAAKGVTANLSLTRLCDFSTQICEALRPGNEALKEQTDIQALVDELSNAYDLTVDRITAYKNTL